MALPDVADTFRISLLQANQGEQLLNVFHYRDAALISPTAAAMAQGFWDKVKAAWRAIPTTTSGYQFISVLAEQLYSPYGFFTYSVPLAEQGGTRVLVSDQLPSFIAGTIKLNVGTRVTRPGSKRISGLTENDVTGQFLNNATITLLQTLGALLDDNYIPTGFVGDVTPVIVGYPTALLPGSPRVQNVTSTTVDSRTSNQLSRKLGH